MSIGELSDTLLWGATTAYAVAFVAFAIDLARLADARSVVARERALAKVGAGVGAGARVGAGSAEAGDAVGHGGAVSAAGGDLAAPGAGRRRAAAIAMSVTLLGLAFHVASAVLRGVAAGRVPWANMYEFTMIGTLVAVATFVALTRWRDVRFLGSIVLGLAVLALGLALAVFYLPADPVQPVLDSYWLVIHVSIATIASGLFTVSFAASALQLLKDSRDSGSVRVGGPRWRSLDALPTARDLEALSFRITAVGFVLWTFTIIAGAIWAEHSWGRYWGWDPKETWSFVVWLIYAAYLHARTTAGWTGRRAAWFVIVGFAAVLFNFTGVNLFFQGKHTYAGG
jgi:cytochrome c-type biogenesis protein CcsB